ncbi:hypothetical protein KI387_034794, partial [Taxus chinensis]
RRKNQFIEVFEESDDEEEDTQGLEDGDGKALDIAGVEHEDENFPQKTISTLSSTP